MFHCDSSACAIGCLAVSMVIFGTAPVVCGQADGGWVVVDLSVAGSGTDVKAINDHADVVGWVNLGGDYLPAIWEGAQPPVPLPEPDFGFLTDINNDGLVAGNFNTTGNAAYFDPFAWSESSGFIPIPMPADGVYGEALAVNDAGTVAGWIATTTNGAVGFTWSESSGTQMIEEFEQIADVNESGQMVGQEYGQVRGLLMNADGSTKLLRPLGGHHLSSAYGVNDLGQAVGVSSKQDCDPQLGWCVIIESLAILWDGNAKVNLGSFSGDYPDTVAYAINNAGQVVGTAFGAGSNRRGFIWEDGVMTDLNDRIDASSGWVLATAADINEHGEIVGEGFLNGWQKPYLLKRASIGDVNLDGAVNVEDLLHLLGTWGACVDCQQCSTDLNDDCAIGVEDLLLLLANWSA